MIKKIAVIMCTCLLAFAQIVSASDTTASADEYDAKSAFYEIYGYQNSADIFYNGQYIEFEDVQPLVLSGTTFVPIRAFCDTIGAEISFVDETFEVIISNGDDQISFIAGSNKVDVNGETVTLSQDTFLLFERTMVPARLISEAFDLQVTWNSEYQQVSIIDVNALKAGIDTDYTLINSALSMSTVEQADKNTMMTGDLTIKSGQMGDEITVSTDFTSIANSDFSLVDFASNCSIDISNLQQELDLALENGTIDATSAQILTDYIKILQDFELNFVFDTQNMEIYIWSDDITTVSELFLNESAVTDGEIIKISYADTLDEQSFLALQNSILSAVLGEPEYTIESLIDNKLAQSAYQNLFETDVYAQALAISQAFKDENFNKKLSVYSLNQSFTIGDTQVDYQFEIKVNSNEEATSYTFDYAYASSIETLFMSISQDDSSQMNMLINQKTYDETIQNYQVLAVNCTINREQTTKSPAEIPLDNLFEISNLS